MPLILGIETASDICSVAIGEGDQVIAERTLTEGMRHSSALTGLVDEVLKEANIPIKELSAVAISNGPGSYTGLRVGASTAKGICYSLNIPLIAVPTLESLAYDIDPQSDDFVLATLDARRMEAYAALYNGGNLQGDTYAIIWDEDSIQSLIEVSKSLIICGTGVEKAASLFEGYKQVIIKPNQCNAKAITSLAFAKYQDQDFCDIAYHDPFYFKNPNITKSKKSVLG